MNTKPLYCYPFVKRAIRRVDHEFGYLYRNNTYIPLRRNNGVLGWLLPWLIYGEWRETYDPTAPAQYFDKYEFRDIDDLSHFFAMFVQD
jgi:hypothetical protein